MKINKILIRIAQFFGGGKTIQHIDDIHVKVVCNWTDERYDDIVYSNDKETPKEIEQIKSTILKDFKDNPKKEKRCKRVQQVYAFLYRNKDSNIGSAGAKCLWYKYDTLFYPNDEDILNLKRIDKLKRITK